MTGGAFRISQLVHAIFTPEPAMQTVPLRDSVAYPFSMFTARRVEPNEKSPVTATPRLAGSVVCTVNGRSVTVQQPTQEMTEDRVGDVDGP